MAKAHDRILELLITVDDSDNFVRIDTVNYYRTRARLDAAEPQVINHTAGALAASHESEMGDAAIPQPTHIRIVPTFQA